MNIRKLFSRLIVPFLLMVWIFVSRISPAADPAPSIRAPKTNFLAPHIVLDSISGEEISLAEFQGQPIIVNFWASWCPPCRAEMPAFQEAWQEYQDTDLVIIAVNATHQDSLKEVEEFIEQNQLAFPILLDKNGSTSASYQIYSLPTTFFIDQDGIIKRILIGGPIPLSLLRIEADQLIKDSQNVSSN